MAFCHQVDILQYTLVGKKTLIMLIKMQILVWVDFG